MIDTTEPSPFKFMRITASPDCTMACQYCNPDREFNPTMMPTLELLETVQAGYDLGIKVVHLTGGEPSMRKDITQLVEGIKKIGIEAIEMTTNGIPFFAKAEELKEAGLTGVNISLDTLDPAKFHAITGVNAFNSVMQAIESSSRLFPDKVAINMVVTKNNIDELRSFMDFSRQMGVMVRFCELTPQGPYMKRNPEFFTQNHVTRDEILEALEEIAPFQSTEKQAIDRQNAHSEYLTLEGDYNDLVVGIIAPYSNGWPCPGTGCTRLRIGPKSANSCVIYPDRNLMGLTYQEKRQVIEDLIEERKQQMANNEFPEHHMPAYLTYRFGLQE